MKKDKSLKDVSVVSEKRECRFGVNYVKTVCEINGLRIVFPKFTDEGLDELNALLQQLICGVSGLCDKTYIRVMYADSSVIALGFTAFSEGQSIFRSLNYSFESQRFLSPKTLFRRLGVSKTSVKRAIAIKRLDIVRSMSTAVYVGDGVLVNIYDDTVGRDVCVKINCKKHFK